MANTVSKDSGALPEANPSSNESTIASSTREELIRQAAHRRYLERGATDGDAVQDWLDAEAEINQSTVE